MGEFLTLKSKASLDFDFRDIDIREYIRPFSVDEVLLERDIDRIRKAYGKKVETTEVSFGDTALISCRSEIGRYNKANVLVMVGKGLYSKELEAELPGRKSGETFFTKVEGTDVEVTVGRITRTLLPELTDENVAAFGLEGVKTVRELKAYCCDRQIAAYLDESEDADMASAMVWKQFAEKMNVVMDPEEEAAAREEAKKFAEKMKDSRPVFEDQEEEAAYIREYEEEFGENPMKMDMDEFAMEMAITSLRIAAAGCQAALQEGTALTMEDYESFLDRWQEAYPEKSRDVLRKDHTLESFLKEHYNNLICDKIDAYILTTFKEKLNPYRG